MKRASGASEASSPGATSAQGAAAAVISRKRPRLDAEPGGTLGFGEEEGSDEEEEGGQDSQPEPTGVDEGVPPAFDDEEEVDYSSLEGQPTEPSPEKPTPTGSAPNPRVTGVATEVPQKEVAVLRGGPEAGCPYLVRNTVSGETYVFDEGESVSIHFEKKSGRHRGYVERRATAAASPKVAWLTPKQGSRAEKEPPLLAWTVWTAADGGERFVHRKYSDGWHDLSVAFTDHRLAH
jgi:hypothetical protein